jgi:hypothetical protein
MTKIKDVEWDRTLCAVIGFMQTPHGEIDILRWLRERESQLDDHSPNHVIAALKKSPIDEAFFGRQLRVTLGLIAENVRRPAL